MENCVICLEAVRPTRGTVTGVCCGAQFHRRCVQAAVLSHTITSPEPVRCPCCRSDPLFAEDILSTMSLTHAKQVARDTIVSIAQRMFDVEGEDIRLAIQLMREEGYGSDEYSDV